MNRIKIVEEGQNEKYSFFLSRERCKIQSYCYMRHALFGARVVPVGS